MNHDRHDDDRVPPLPEHDDADLPPFPPEEGWLQQPLPPELAEFAEIDWAAFTERTLAALRDERDLDQKLQELDADLPRIVLSSYEAPKPAPDFVPSVLAALHTDRQSRWQQLLARHVAPEPSPQFVARTLAALRLDQLGADGASDPAGPAATPTAARHPFSGPRGAGSQGPGSHGIRPRTLPRILPWLALAAGALLWLALRDGTPPPFEARLAAHAPRLQAHGSALSPLPAALAKLARDDDPTAFDSASPDGVWLQLARGSRR